ncbi:EAL domain, c-di-GMP-specific phosphodiesterase class I (or its enzymatically inactive variant) [Dethiosulfatibacter aminovorans DSM 17477]|uniref:EAL domain, c-di-GMP-specific phosphodiesterase class I (Or its enzymatically inactive variant) n=1 Tax=Dethiosulfatibacter aminovorans DSM 17477 TaxID=1121476 RepID=A0A1M6LBH5_9FIRM|nr:EAL domain-containing protein [Dethiosulfatibacter aminovorans]SHJ68518.1 EAL domain, c-di-GMP-specific phosphodiesterase class I (or its enzymatically inactive variant) [Dethiosulfatibacter aminovorans DSM 17477]
MLNDEVSINEYNGLKNVNKLYEDLDILMNDEDINEFTAFVFEVTNLSRINKFNDYSISRKSIQYTIDIAKEIFDKCEPYSLCNNEFVLILEESNIDATYKKSIQFLEIFNNPILINNVPINLELKSSILKYPIHGDKTEIFCNNLSRSLLQEGREIDNLSIFSNSLADVFQKEHSIMCEIFHALNNNELRVEYQPIYNMIDDVIIGVEALLRWDSLKMNIGEIIDIVERHDLINYVTKWVAKEVIKQLSEWKKKGITTKVFIKVSSEDLKNDYFLNYLVKSVEKSDIESSMLGIELTERCIYNNIRSIEVLLNKFIKHGFEISLDNYGTGYNLLRNVFKYPCHNIKIDKFFISNIENDAAYSFIEGVINSAKEFDINVFAEGVETETQFMILQSLGCQVIQGYYFSKPLKPEDISKQLMLAKEQLL